MYHKIKSRYGERSSLSTKPVLKKLTSSTAITLFGSLWTTLVAVVESNIGYVLVGFAALLGLGFGIHLVRKYIARRKV